MNPCRFRSDVKELYEFFIYTVHYIIYMPWCISWKSQVRYTSSLRSFSYIYAVDDPHLGFDWYSLLRRSAWRKSIRTVLYHSSNENPSLLPSRKKWQCFLVLHRKALITILYISKVYYYFFQCKIWFVIL